MSGHLSAFGLTLSSSIGQRGRATTRGAQILDANLLLLIHSAKQTIVRSQNGPDYMAVGGHHLIGQRGGEAQMQTCWK